MEEFKTYKNIEHFLETMELSYQFEDNLGIYMIGLPCDQLIFSLDKDAFIGGTYDSIELADEYNDKYSFYKKIQFKGLSLDLKQLHESLDDFYELNESNYNTLYMLINNIRKGLENV